MIYNHHQPEHHYTPLFSHNLNFRLHTQILLMLKILVMPVEPQGENGGEMDLFSCCWVGFKILQKNCYPENLIYYVESQLFVSRLSHFKPVNVLHLK